MTFTDKNDFLNLLLPDYLTFTARITRQHSQNNISDRGGNCTVKFKRLFIIIIIIIIIFTIQNSTRTIDIFKFGARIKTLKISIQFKRETKHGVTKSERFGANKTKQLR